MKLNLNQEIELTHCIDMLQIHLDVNDKTTESSLFTDDQFNKGFNFGTKLTNDSFRGYIERLEKLVKELTKDE